MYITIITSINAGMWRRCGPQYEKSEFWSVVSTGVMLVGEARETAQVQNTKQEKNDKRGWEGEASEEMRAHMRMTTRAIGTITPCSIRKKRKVALGVAHVHG